MNDIDESVVAVGRSNGEIDAVMDLWDIIDDAVHETDDELPSGDNWLPADVEVEVEVRVK